MTMVLQPDLCPPMRRPQVWQPLYAKEPTPPVGPSRRPNHNYGLCIIIQPIDAGLKASNYSYELSILRL